MKNIKAEQVLNLVAEATSKPIGSVKDLKAGDNVMFKPGTAHAGMVGFIVQIRQETNKVDLKFGKATSMDVDVADLLLVDSSIHAESKEEGADEDDTTPITDEDLVGSEAFDMTLLEDASVTEEDLQAKLAPLYNKIKGLDMKWMQAARQFDASNKLSAKKSALKKKKAARAEMDKIYKEIRKLKGKK